MTYSGLTFADASKKEDKTQLKPALGESRGLGDGFPRAQAPDGIHQVLAQWTGEMRLMAGWAGRPGRGWDQEEGTSLVCKLKKGSLPNKPKNLKKSREVNPGPGKIFPKEWCHSPSDQRLSENICELIFGGRYPLPASG